MISLKELNKAEVLAALYNASKPLGLGFLQYDPSPMTAKEATELLQKRSNFDYLKGRVMKVNLSGDEFDPRWYNRDVGQGAAEEVINALKAGEEVDGLTISSMHKQGKDESIIKVREAMNRPTTSSQLEKVSVIHIGLDDVADKLGPAVDAADK